MKIKYLFLTLAAALIAGCSDDLDRSGAYNPALARFFCAITSTAEEFWLP